MSRPLQGTRVLDLSRLLPGPYCSLILAELGAEVIKVEDPRGGDWLRSLPPVQQGIGGAFYALNRGKRSLAVDLKHPAGRALLLRLLQRFNVLVESFRPGVLERLGLGYEELKRTCPRLILCSISGYGQDGPMRARAGHDINYAALAGVLAIGGDDGGFPALPGVQIADLAGGGLWAAIRILAALHSGEGAHLDVSMTEGAMSLLLPWIGDLSFGGAPLRRGRGPLNGGAPNYGLYRTADDRYLAVGSLEPKFLAQLREALADDEGAPLETTADVLAQRIERRTLAEWAERLREVDACVEPVLEIDELADHPQHRERRAFFEIDDPRRGSVRQLRLPLGEPFATAAAPALGEHTDEILREEGLSSEEIDALRADGAIT